jgi:hypothetical protein
MPANFARWSAWIAAMALAAGCSLNTPEHPPDGYSGDAEKRLQDRFGAYVEGANRCDDAIECTVAPVRCPLGCYVAVRRDRADDVRREAETLLAAHNDGGATCVYQCIPPGAVMCVEHRCALGPGINMSAP